MIEKGIFSGYGLLSEKKQLVYSLCGQSTKNRSLCEIVRDRDFPDSRLVIWAQSKLGGQTVTMPVYSSG